MYKIYKVILIKIEYSTKFISPVAMLIPFIDKNSDGKKTNCESEGDWSMSRRDSEMRSLKDTMGGSSEVTKWETRSG